MAKVDQTKTTDSISLAVKEIILDEIQDHDVNPEDLAETYNLEDDLGYDGVLITSLSIALNKFLKSNNGGKISPSEIEKCKTVKDVIDLVKTKIQKS